MPALPCHPLHAAAGQGPHTGACTHAMLNSGCHPCAPLAAPHLRGSGWAAAVRRLADEHGASAADAFAVCGAARLQSSCGHDFVSEGRLALGRLDSAPAAAAAAGAGMAHGVRFASLWARLNQVGDSAADAGRVFVDLANAYSGGFAEAMEAPLLLDQQLLERQQAAGGALSAELGIGGARRLQQARSGAATAPTTISAALNSSLPVNGSLAANGTAVSAAVVKPAAKPTSSSVKPAAGEAATAAKPAGKPTAAKASPAKVTSGKKASRSPAKKASPSPAKKASPFPAKKPTGAKASPSPAGESMAQQRSASGPQGLLSQRCPH